VLLTGSALVSTVSISEQLEQAVFNMGARPSPLLTEATHAASPTIKTLPHKPNKIRGLDKLDDYILFHVIF